MLPPGSLERLQRFAAAVESAAPGIMAGLYAVGSLALGDYLPSLSNLDLVAVADAPWSSEELQAAQATTRSLANRHAPPRLGYLSWSDLADGPARGGGACFEGRRTLPAAELLNPLTAQIMRTAAICVRGPEYPELWTGDLRAWAAERLTGHWGRWLETTARRPGSLSLRRATCAPVLEASRLVVAMRSGRVVSKLEAGTSAIEGSPSSRSQRILKDAVGYRSGSHTSMYWGPFERRDDTVHHVAACVEEAGRT